MNGGCNERRNFKVARIQKELKINSGFVINTKPLTSI